MAEIKRIALFVFGEEETFFAKRLLPWAENLSEVTIFSDKPQQNQLHYLTYPAKNQENLFDLTIYDIDNTTAHSHAFHYLIKWPGVVFLNDIHLQKFAAGTSFHPSDPWGFGWFINQLKNESCKDIVNLAAQDFLPEDFFEHHPLGRVLCSHSPVAVVRHYDDAVIIEGQSDRVHVEIFEDYDDQGSFSEIISGQLTAWKQRVNLFQKKEELINHPHFDLLKVETKKLRERFSQKNSLFVETAIAELAALMRN